MKQTAVQELILEFQELKKTKLYETSFKAIDDCINLAIAKLELEKQQIIGARLTAPSELITYSKTTYLDEAEEYYNETFKK